MSEWHEEPIFVPVDGGHIAAIVTMPAVTPRALVLLLTGWGATRSHRGRIWTSTARALAERGIASARFDYPGIGDSSGSRTPSMDDPPIAEALAVLEAALGIAGDVEVGVAGNCIGARTAFSVAARVPECRTAVGLLRKPGEIVRRRPMRSGRLGATAPRARRSVDRMAQKVASRLRSSSFRFAPDVEAVLGSRRCLLMFLGDPDLAAVLAGPLDRLTRDSGGESEIRVVPTQSIAGFRIPLSLQPEVIGAVVEWMDVQLPDGDRGSVVPHASNR